MFFTSFGASVSQRYVFHAITLFPLPNNHNHSILPPFLTGYVQGMNDLASPILFVMEDPVLAYWCFAAYMKRMVSSKRRKE